MKALILNRPLDLVIGEMPDPSPPGAGEVRIRVGAVGICGSDVHFFERGRIGDFVVTAPLVLGHEAAGTVESAGPGVDGLVTGDRVAMEPGVPCGRCDLCRAGRYHLCPEMRFWAVPSVHGALREYVVHPAAFTYRLPEGISLEEGTLLEPLAVAVHTCNLVGIAPGDVVAVNGVGPIGCAASLVALARGAASVIAADVVPERLDRARSLGAAAAVDARSESLADAVMELTDGHGADIGIECSGHPSGPQTLIRAAAPGGRIALVGMGPQPVEIDTVGALVKEVALFTVFRYANVYQTAIDLVASGRIRVAPLITDRYPFDRAVEAFEYARTPRPETLKIVITL